MATLDEQLEAALEAAQEKVAQIKARQRDREARQRQVERKERNRGLLLWGASMEYSIKHATDQGKRDKLIESVGTGIAQAFSGQNQRDKEAARGYLDRVVAALPPLDDGKGRGEGTATPTTTTMPPGIEHDPH